MEGENLDKLPDIQIGIKMAQDLLHGIDIQDILKPENLDAYFKKYYDDRGDLKKSYELPPRNHTVLDLISANDTGYLACGERDKREISKYLSFMHAFRDARNAFSIIDSDTIGVIVPYEKGNDFIRALNGSVENPKELLKLFRKVQPYTVNVFSYELEQLERMGAVYQTRQGLLALKEAYYDLAIGIKFEK